ncbi:MAG: inorganic phosphate transporter [bacterium]
MESLFVILVLVVIAAWLFDFANGLNDAANAIATVVSTRVLTPIAAVVMAAIFNFIGALISVEVATTIGKGLVDPKFIDIYAIFAAALSAFLWTLLTSLLGLPISCSHALIGGIIGAAISHASFDVINYKNLFNKVFIPSIVAPFVGIFAALIFSLLSYFAASFLKLMNANKAFRILQLFSASFMALSHGANDAQKTMGIIAMALVVAGVTNTFQIPLWVKLSAAFFMFLGTLVGGWRVIKTMGMKLTKLRPIDGFSAETSAATTIIVASQLGMPISTTYVIAASIMGVGLTKKITAVKWSLFFTILTTWLLTVPMSALIAFVIYKSIKYLSLLF